MGGLPPSLCIALSLAGALWLVAIATSVFDAPAEIVYGVFVMGLLTAAIEWLAYRRGSR
jgi:hypothetical protein